MIETTSGIEVTTGFTPMAMILHLTHPKLVLDDGPVLQAKWGTEFLPASPGEHTLRCFFRCTFLRHAGDATTKVGVPTDGIVTVTYAAPTTFGWRPGTWTVSSP